MSRSKEAQREADKRRRVKHRDRLVVQRRALYARHKKAGICLDCHKRKAEGGVRCAACKGLRKERRDMRSPLVEAKTKRGHQQMPLPIGNVQTKRRLSDIPERFLSDHNSREYREHLRTFRPRTRPFTPAEVEADRIEEMLALSQLRLSYLSRSPL